VREPPKVGFGLGLAKAWEGKRTREIAFKGEKRPGTRRKGGARTPSVYSQG
jgi:hypothetical protein